jgi:hypothetical protein
MSTLKPDSLRELDSLWNIYKRKGFFPWTWTRGDFLVPTHIRRAEVEAMFVLLQVYLPRPPPRTAQTTAAAST